jgi:hypothetical protein
MLTPGLKIVSSKDRSHLVNARRMQRALYVYFLDPDVGLIDIRLTTRFPFTVQVYVNGNSWLAQQKIKHELGSTSKTTRSRPWMIPEPLRSWPIRSPIRTGPRSSRAWLAASNP